MRQPGGTTRAQHQEGRVPSGTVQGRPRPSEVTPPPMREVTKGWFSNRERLVPRAVIEADERRK